MAASKRGRSVRGGDVDAGGDALAASLALKAESWVVEREIEHRASAKDASTPRDRMARVRVDEQTWREFRQAVGTKPIAERLGELVAGDVAAHRRRRIRAGAIEDREVVAALKRARELGRDLAAITERLERLRARHRHTAEPQRTAAHRPILVEGGERSASEPEWWPNPPGNSMECW